MLIQHATTPNESFIAYGIDKKWHGFTFKDTNDLAKFKACRNFIYIIDVAQIDVRLSSKKVKVRLRGTQG